MIVRSFAGGEWVEGTEASKTLHSAVTGEPVAEIAGGGLDYAAMLDYAREAGGPALRNLTFHQRALRLKELAKYLLERKEDFYRLSTATGATRTDSWIDIEGGIGTLFTFASKGRRELPNSTVYIDGGPEPLSKNGTFIGQHVCLPLEGVAIHINVPVHGMYFRSPPMLRISCASSWL